MKTHYLLDTNTVSYFLRRQSEPLVKRVKRVMREGTGAISVLTRAELRKGQALLADDDRRRPLIDGFLAVVSQLVWTAEAADHYGVVSADRHRRGRRRGELDTLLAAHALAEGRVFVTHNARHFEDVRGLRVEDWFE